MLAGIFSDEVPMVWPEVKDMLAKAHARGHGDYALEDIYAGLCDRSYQLWVWHEDQVIKAAAVTCIAVYPRRKICCLMMIGGSALRMWKDDAQEIMVAWAKAQGCDRLEGYDTRAWLRVLKDWKAMWTVIRREI